jgi:putative oxidoreductase
MMQCLKDVSRGAESLLRRFDWVGPLAARVSLGVVFVVTGWGKLHSLEKVTSFFDSLHIPAPHANAVLVALVEFVGGLALIAGLGTRVASLLLIGVMAVAIGTAKLPDLHGVVDLVNTVEFTYLVVFVWLLVSGAGRASIDRWLCRDCGA